VDSVDQAVIEILSGPAVLFIEGERQAIAIDVREYPVRSIEEPDLERVTRGSHEGLVETIVFNTAMIRRRLRDPSLRFAAPKVGRPSQNDVLIGCLADLAAPRLVDGIKGRTKRANPSARPMAAKNLEEILVDNPWNPVPTVRYTERPDVVAAHLLEGH